MKVFITGVAGFMGSHLADRLIKNGDYVVGVDNLVGGDIANVNPKVEFYNEDCDNLEKMVEYMKGCDVVFHAACTAHDGFSLFSPYYITKNTFQITISVTQRNLMKRKTVVYSGAIWPEWFDWDIMSYLIEMRPQYDFLMIGAYMDLVDRYQE